MKRRKKYCLLFICTVFLISVLGGCTNDSQATAKSTKIEGLDKLNEIQVISREDGSGTRSTFAQLAGFLDNTEGKIDLTTENAQIAKSTEEVCSFVEQNVSAIGYISMGALPENDNIKALKVNGVSPNLEEKAYPLGRTFYLAYGGKLSELEEDFLTYVHGAGQEIVAESYLPVAKSGSFLSNKASGEISIGGSTSVAPLMEKLANAYMELNPNAKITIETSDSGDGLTRAMSGKLDLAMSSRELEDYEAELLDYEAIARDNIAVVVNAENPLEDITIDALKDIFTGNYVKWEELNQ